jgi:outer membrane protein OmpA-like peptidoglycan-associated protein/tetratricopeptide (TPR) repeat protein
MQYKITSLLGDIAKSLMRVNILYSPFRVGASLLLFISIVFSVTAQDENTCSEMENKKAKKAYEAGIDKKNKKEERLVFLKKALELEPDYVEANFAYADERIKTLIYENASFKPVEEYYKKIIELCPKYHSDPYYYLGFIYYEDKNWEEAEKYLKQYLNFKDDDEKKFNKNYDALLSQAKKMLKFAKFFNDIYKNPVPFDPNPVEGICTEKDEYLPIITADDEMLLFTRKQPSVNKDSPYASDKEIELFSYSKRNKETGVFDKGKRMPYPFNKKGAEGGATMSINNKHLFFTMCNDEGGAQVNCDIYFSDFIAGEWTEPKKVEGINDPVYWDSQPSLASDGKTLYFTSDRKGSYGGTDIFKTVKDIKTGVWSKPENLGRVINTAGNEMSPFVHSDFQSIYFSSDGHPGVGGMDIFYARKDSIGNWTTPKNIGIPINTSGDDLGFFVSTDGHLGYFASNLPSRVKGKSVGKYDIYSFELYKDARPDDVAFFTGKIEDKSNGTDKNFTVEVKDAVTKKVTEALVDTTSGEYTVIVNTKIKNDLVITAKKDNYAFSSQLVLKDSIKSSKPVKVNVVVDTIKVGQGYTLNNIYYKTNSDDLEQQSIAVIEEFSEYLKSNPKIKIEVWGHTDNVGNDQANAKLSTDRAFSVREMLIAKGVNKVQLIDFKGWGATKPISDNYTELGRAKNRRTEFMIISK